jgi:transposase
MRKPTKFVAPLTQEQYAQLVAIMRANVPHRTRMRAHAVLLSARGYSLDEIADIYQVDRDRVSAWLERWTAQGVAGLDDDARSGRPPALTPEERQEAVVIVKKEPRSLKQALNEIAVKMGKVVCPDTLRSYLRAAQQVWKRVRRSLRSRRDEALFREVEAQLHEWRAWCARGDCPFELYYFDESGFTLTPCVPYAWQGVGERLEVPSGSSKRQNVLGFLRWDGGEFVSYAFEGIVDSEIVGECFRRFQRESASGKPKLVVLDNASIHVSGESLELWEELAEAGLEVLFLPTYAPELNLIEMLWKKIKYQWMPLWAYESYQKLTASLFEILAGVSSKYLITFS